MANCLQEGPLLATPILSAALPLGAQKVFVTTDISPDSSSYKSSGGNNSAGRIKALVVDPNDASIVCAAAEFAGVWKYDRRHPGRGRTAIGTLPPTR